VLYAKKLVLNKLLSLIFPFIITFAFVGCGDGVSNQTEGVIEYKVTYPKMEKDNFMRDFMPDKMFVKFKNNNYSNSLSAGMGMFKSSFICSKDNNEYIQLVKLINKKYSLQLDGEGIAKSMSSKPAYTIEFTNEVKEILGYNCTKAIVNVNNEEQDAFTVYYTEKINIETPNWCNEFSEIPGVMLEYQYEKYGVCMRFTAKKIEFKKVDDDEFVLPSGYKMLSEPEMDKEMQEIFDSFK
jgi:GLPGLI family protein